MTFRWNTVPLFRYLLAFCAGVVLQIFLPGYFTNWLLVFGISLAGIISFTYIKSLAINYNLRWAFGLIATLLFISTGSIITFIQTDFNYSNHFSKYEIKDCNYVGYLSEPLTEKTSSFKSVIKVTAIVTADTIISTSGNLLVYFEKDSSLAKLKYGDEIIFPSKLQAIPEPRNPSEFNYKRFLYFHQINRQCYIKGNDLQVSNIDQGNFIFHFAYSVRKKFTSILQNSIADKRQYAVAEALTVGNEDDLDQELIQAFASAGALHVLSVSGMHVGLIYMSLLFFLVWTDKIKNAHHFKFSVVLLLVWIYALITGLSPSILRSAAMITLMILAKWSGRTSNVYNTLGVSAFLLLLINPYYLTEVGFQLSYAAVFGIVYLHPMIFRWFEPESKLVSNLWLITSVSIAAQTMTFPLGLLYFHQFPNLFIISNLIIIPLSTIIIYGGILIISLSWIPYASVVIGKILWGIIWIINFTVLTVDSWQYSIIQGISISVLETWLIYLIVFFSILFLTTKKAMHIQQAMISLIVVLIFQVFESYQIHTQKKIIVFSVKNHSALNLVDGKENIFITDSVLRKDRSKMLFHIVHYWWDLGVDNAEPRIAFASMAPPLKSDNYIIQKPFINFYNKTILQIDSTCNLNTIENLHIDYAIVSSNALDNLKRIRNISNKTLLLIDGSNNFKTVKKIISYCEANNIKYYDINEKGAFVAEL